MKSIRDILHPVSLDELAQAVDRQVLYVRATESGRFERLFGARYFASLDEDVSAVRSTSGAATEVLTAKNSVTTDCSELFDQGYTLVVAAAQRRSNELEALRSALAEELRCVITVNAYITPPRNRGFLGHYDNHDVLVLQVEGTKRWKLGTTTELPLETRCSAANAVTDCTTEVILGPGDVLYIPRGIAHAPEALNLRSVHLTVALYWPRFHEAIADRFTYSSSGAGILPAL